MIFEMGIHGTSRPLFLIIERQCRNQTFLAVYDDVEKAKKLCESHGVVIIPNHILKSCSMEDYEWGHPDNPLKRKVLPYQTSVIPWEDLVTVKGLQEELLSLSQMMEGVMDKGDEKRQQVAKIIYGHLVKAIEEIKCLPE